MSIKVLAALLTATTLLGAGTLNAGQPTVDQQAKQLAPFKKLLSEALQNGLKGGTTAAMEACQLMAPALQSNLSSGLIELGRATHKPRNTNNVVEPWMHSAHLSYLQGDSSSAQQVELEDGATGYIEPIYVKAGCLQCHGSVLTPEVSDYLAKHYPDDRATGFSLGDYRGLFWLKTIPAKRPQ